MDSEVKIDRTFLKEWRVFAGLTQEEVGELMGVTSSQVSRIETGSRIPDLLYLQKFKDMLNAHLGRRASSSVRVTHIGELLMCQPDPLDLITHGAFAHHHWRQLVEDIAEQLGVEIPERENYRRGTPG